MQSTLDEMPGVIGRDYDPAHMRGDVVGIDDADLTEVRYGGRLRSIGPVQVECIACGEFEEVLDDHAAYGEEHRRRRATQLDIEAIVADGDVGAADDGFKACTCVTPRNRDMFGKARAELIQQLAGIFVRGDAGSGEIPCVHHCFVSLRVRNQMR